MAILKRARWRACFRCGRSIQHRGSDVLIIQARRKEYRLHFCWDCYRAMESSERVRETLWLKLKRIRHREKVTVMTDDEKQFFSE